MRKSVIFTAAGAVVLLAASATVRFAVYPAIDQVPAGFNATAGFSGTASLLDASALAKGDDAHAFVSNLPVTATQQVKVTSTAGRTAVFSDALAVVGPDGKTLLQATRLYAADRVTLDAASAPAGSKALAHTGLSVGFPLSPQKTTYRFWDPTTQQATPAAFSAAGTVGGRSAYTYTIHAAGAVKDPTTLSALPAALPKATLVGLASALPAAERAQLAPMLPELPATLPLSYTAVTDTTISVDQATGYVLSVAQHEVVTANLVASTGQVPLSSVLDLSLRSTTASIATDAHSASQAQTGLLLVGTIAPIVLGVIGLLLAALALWLHRRRTKIAPPSETVSEPVA